MNLLTEELRRVADAAAHDIAGDFPNADTNYDMYVEEIRGRTFGVIDMGDVFSASYEWDATEGEWVQLNFDPFLMTEAILAHRRFPEALELLDRYARKPMRNRTGS